MVILNDLSAILFVITVDQESKKFIIKKRNIA